MIQGWKREVEGEYVKLMRRQPRLSPQEVAESLGISESSAVYWLTELAREGRVRIVTVELVNDGAGTGDDASPP